MAKSNRVLIVDDIEENLRVIGSVLGDNGIIVSAARSGEQALHHVNIKPPDLILLDISMPGMDGLEVCQILKKDERTKEIPVIFLTARSESSDIVKGFEQGAVDYITKPFNKNELLSRVFTHLELKNSKDLIKQQVASIENLNNALAIKNTELESHNLKLKEINATKDKFFSIIAHDLKNPFSTLLGFSDLLLKNLTKFDDNKKTEFIKIIHDNAKNTYNLLENLLTWSRSQRGLMECKPEKVVIASLIMNNFISLSQAAQIKNISLQTHVSEEIEAYVDRNMINTIIRNLLTNALKFTPSGGTVKVLAKTVTIENEEKIQICIEDSGIGISQNNIEKVFNISESYTTLGTDNEKGTGLGLILCKEFVMINGGSIWVESEVDKGSKFFIELNKG